MSTNTCEIVKYRPEFKQQVVELQTDLWSPNLELNTAYFEWKHERNPYLDQPLIYLVLVGERVVGMRAIFGAKWEIGCPTQTLINPCGADLVIAPDYRKQELFRRIMQVAVRDLADQGYSYFFNLSAGSVTRVASLVMGWRSIGSLQLLHWKSGHDRIHQKTQPFLLLDQADLEGRQKINGKVSIANNPRPTAMAELVERLGHDGRIRHMRDLQYFTWRFQNPLSQYRFLFWQEGRLEGYIVLQSSVSPSGGVGVNIVDWEASDTHIGAELLHAAILCGDFNSLSIWSATLPEATKKVLRDASFKEANPPKSITSWVPTVTVRSISDGNSEADWVLASRRILALDSWDLRMIYSDGY